LTIVARDAVGGRAGAAPRRGVADADAVTLVACRTDDGDSNAQACPAGVGLGAEITVAAGCAVVHRSPLAAVRRLVADAVVADVAPRAGIRVVAEAAVGLGRVGARAGHRVAGSGEVALIGGRADGRIAAPADARLAGIGLGARVAVVARAALGLRRVGA